MMVARSRSFVGQVFYLARQIENLPHVAHVTGAQRCGLAIDISVCGSVRGATGAACLKVAAATP